MQGNSSLFIEGLELPVYLGWTNNERAEKQIVLLDIDMYFVQPPRACISDQLDDTVCYSALITNINQHLLNKTFHLIEFLTSELYRFIKQQIPHPSNVIVRISKRPKDLGVGCVQFSYGDSNEC